MRILLIDVDSTIPNLALMKVSSFYKRRGGDTVGFDVENPDMAYVSVIFRKHKQNADSICEFLRIQNPNIVIDVGGPGYDLKKQLPEEIENCLPDYNLYPHIDYAMGFTTRGCIRRCPFCIVPIKEGPLKRIQPIEEIYDPRFKQIKLLDNNVLADMDNFRHIAQFCIERKIKLDISQGLDARLLTEESAGLLAQIHPMCTFVFAFDSLSYRKYVERAVDLLKKAGVNVRTKVQFYVYCDDSVTGEYGIESALKRCRLLKEMGTNPYVMLNIDSTPSAEMKRLKRWANRKRIFWTVDYEDYSTSRYQIGMSRKRNQKTLDEA